MALLELQRSNEYDVRGLVTTLNRENGQIGFHGINRELVRAQAVALGLPVAEVLLPPAATNAQYECAMRDGLTEQDVAAIAYGDVFLEDIRAYREALAARMGFRPLFPVWKRDTRQLAAKFIAAGFRAIIVSVDLARLDISFAGREFDASFLADLPPHTDPCGENGEFHTFVYDGPNFTAPVKIARVGGSECRGYRYCEISLYRGLQIT